MPEIAFAIQSGDESTSNSELDWFHPDEPRHKKVKVPRLQSCGVLLVQILSVGGLLEEAEKIYWDAQNEPLTWIHSMISCTQTIKLPLLKHQATLSYMGFAIPHFRGKPCKALTVLQLLLDWFDRNCWYPSPLPCTFAFAPNTFSWQRGLFCSWNSPTSAWLDLCCQHQASNPSWSADGQPQYPHVPVCVNRGDEKSLGTWSLNLEVWRLAWWIVARGLGYGERHKALQAVGPAFLPCLRIRVQTTVRACRGSLSAALRIARALWVKLEEGMSKEAQEGRFVVGIGFGCLAEEIISLYYPNM